jgi:hypothetical protein
MCNLATQKQLQELSFIDSIVPDLELNIFHIYFNQKQEIDFGLIKQKVEDAGFFVAELKVLYNVDQRYTYHEPLLFLEKSVLFVKHYQDQKVAHVFKFIEEGYVTSKELKKYKSLRKEMVLSSNSSDMQLILNKKMYYVVEE